MIGDADAQEILKLQKQIQQDVNSIKRAIYGDEMNKVPGLIDRQIIDEKEIARLKDAKKKFYWIAAGFLMAIQFVREFVVKLFQ